MSLLVFEFAMENVMAKPICVIYFAILHSALDVDYAVSFIALELEIFFDFYSRFCSLPFRMSRVISPVCSPELILGL
jgi:hypothetical protein